MALPTKVNICSQASLLIGGNDIQYLEGDNLSFEAVICNEMYDRIYKGLLQERPWTFAKNYIKLQKLQKESPIAKHIYLVSNEVIQVLNLLPNNAPWKLVGRNEIHCDSEVEWAEVYTIPQEKDLPQDFVTLLVYAIAAEIAYPITETRTKSEFYQAKYHDMLRHVADNDMMRETVDGYMYSSDLFESNFY